MSAQPFSWNNLKEKKAAYEEASALSYQELWGREAQRLHWASPFTQVHDGQFAGGEWFINGKINASVNCLDRHLEKRGDQSAIVFENEAGEVSRLSFRELYQLSGDIASMLYQRGIRAGDRVAIYLPLKPEAIASMLACARLGAIHTVVFGGFAKEALIDRIEDAQAKAIITSESTTRKGHTLKLKETVDQALADPRCTSIETLLYFGKKNDLKNSKEVLFEKQSSWPDLVKNPPALDAQHPLFILYTSGTTGKPKGIFHATGGYLTQVASTTKWVFDLKDEDLYWCTADVGWITGHSYLCYGPLLSGKSIFIFEGALNYPDPRRVYQLIERHKISILYTAPTAIRMFMAAGEEHRSSIDLSSLRLLGSVGEPINPAAWSWYRRVFSDDRCEVIDSWWQTETGAMMIVPIPGVHRCKAGSASKAFLGIDARIVDEKAQACKTNEAGYLTIAQAWPSLARGIWGDQDRFNETYFTRMPGSYFTGDGAHKDEEGDTIISGRIDDVVNISGHRLGTAEVEGALVAHEAVAEAAVVGIPDDITGQKIVAFVTLMPGIKESSELEEKLKGQVKNTIGSFARPAAIHFAKSLPKTRSGKIMRRLLRAIAQGEKISTDISTLEDTAALSLLS